MIFLSGAEGNETYDFIVIGSGPSGAVIANRLSEVPEWRVLLLEAGQEPSIITDIPFLSGTLQFTDYNWGYRAEQQQGFCKGYSLRAIFIGKSKNYVPRLFRR